MDLTVGVLGTGRMAQLHSTALRAIQEQGLVVNGENHDVSIALYGRDPAKVAPLAAACGAAKTSTDLESFIDDPALNVIDNCLVNRLHFTPLLQAIQNGKHVYTDKPLTNTAAEGRYLLRAARQAGVHHGIVQNMRFQAGPAKAKEIIASGALGRILHVRGVFGYFVPQRVENRPAWFYQKAEAGGGIVHDMMAHFFDLLGWMIGPIARVSCDMTTVFPERETPDGERFRAELEDAATVQLRFQNSALGDVFVSWARRKHEEVPYFEIDGEDGSLIFSFNAMHQQLQSNTPGFRYDPTQLQADPMSGWESVALESDDPFETQLRAFLKAIVTGAPVRPDWEDGVRALELVEAAYESADHGRAVLV